MNRLITALLSRTCHLKEGPSIHVTFRSLNYCGSGSGYSFKYQIATIKEALKELEYY